VTKLSLPQLLQPDLVAAGTVADLQLHQLLAQGIRALVLDVDRTLLPRRGQDLPPTVEAWLRRAQQTLPLHLFSNNPSRHRIGGVAAHLGVSFTTSAGKPRRGPLRRVMEQLDLPHGQVAIVGDRVFTDVLAGNRLGLFTVLVKPINAQGLPHPNDRLQVWELGLVHHLAHPLWKR